MRTVLHLKCLTDLIILKCKIADHDRASITDKIQCPSHRSLPVLSSRSATLFQIIVRLMASWPLSTLAEPFSETKTNAKFFLACSYI